MRAVRFSRVALLLVVAACGSAPLACGGDDVADGRAGAPGAAADLADLERETGTTWSIEKHPALGTPSFLEPRGTTKPWLLAGQKPEEAALAFLGKFRAVFRMDDPARDLALEESGRDDAGLAHASFTQTSKGLPVLGTRTSMVFAPDGTIAFLSGHSVPNVDRVSRVASLGADDATARALAGLGAIAAGRSVDPEQRPSPQLAIHATTESDARLVYDVTIALDGLPTVVRRVLVDAVSGAIVRTESLTHHASAPGVLAYLPAAPPSGTTRHDAADVRTFSSVKVAGKEYLGRAAATGKPEIQGFDASKVTTGSAWCGTAAGNIKTAPRLASPDGTKWDDAKTLARKIVCKDEKGNVTSTSEADGRGVAPSSLPVFERVEEHFRTVLKRPINKVTGPIIKVYFHSTSDDFNASWSGGSPGFFSIGDIVKGEDDPVAGTDSRGLAVSFGTATDVMAHEYQHAVTQQTVKLEYAEQSGALNESLSDVYGAIVERAVVGSSDDNYRIGEEWLGAGQTALRSMKDPYDVLEALRQPFHMKLYDRLPVDGDNDWGGVHANSGIPNFVFYLIVEGGSNCPRAAAQKCEDAKIEELSVAKGIGWADATTVWQGILDVKGIPPRSSFADFARASVAVAEAKLAGAKNDPEGPVRTIACAWVATGVLTADEAKRNWNIVCDATAETLSSSIGDCITNPLLACDKAQPKQNLVCSWTGDVHCCKKPFAVKTVCYSDDDCASGEVCARATNDVEQSAVYTCVARGATACVGKVPARPDAGADASADAGSD